MSLGFEKSCRLMACVMFFLTLGGCLSVEVKEETPPDSNLTLAISAHPLTNLDLSGRPSPTVVRVYQLRKEVDFKESGFFDLYDRDKDLLAADLLSREEYVVAPGSVVNHQMVINPEARFVAVLAAFQNTENAVHKQFFPITSQSDVSLVAYLNANALTMAANGMIQPNAIRTAPALPTQMPSPAQAPSQGVQLKDGEVVVNPTKLGGCKDASVVEVLLKEGC